MVSLMGCHGAKSCFDQAIEHDIVGLWTMANSDSIEHHVEFKLDGTGLSRGLGYFAPLINTDIAIKFTWNLNAENKLLIIWTNVNEEKAQTEVQVYKSKCKRLRISDPLSDHVMIWNRN